MLQQPNDPPHGVSVLLLLLACATPPAAEVPHADPVEVAAPAPPEPPSVADLPPPGEPRYAASHILIAYEGAVDSTAERSEADALALAQQLHEQLATGADFAALAQAHSDGPSAPRGGSLGVYATGTMVPDFEKAVAAAGVGELGPVVHTPFGWHVVRRDAVVEATAAHILVSFEGAWRSKQSRSRDEAMQRIQAAQRELQQQAKPFAEVAAAYSDDNTAASGGQLGRVAPGQMVPAFDEALFALEVGADSDIVETPYGFHLIRRLP